MIPENRIHDDPAAEATERIEVSDDEVVEVEDSTGDFNIPAKLPPHSIYLVQWKARDEDGVYAGKTRKEPHRAYVAASLVGAVQDEEFEGTPVYVNHINSLTMRGKPTSELHHFLNVCGSPAPAKSTIGELRTFTAEVLEQTPVAFAELDWKASYKNSKGDYVDLALTMEKFPKHYVEDENTGKKSWDGTYEQQFPNPETGEAVNAQLYVRKHLTQAEANKQKSKARSA
jgi:hypothetical protein